MLVESALLYGQELGLTLVGGFSVIAVCLNPIAVGGLTFRNFFIAFADDLFDYRACLRWGRLHVGRTSREIVTAHQMLEILACSFLILQRKASSHTFIARWLSCMLVDIKLLWPHILEFYSLLVFWTLFRYLIKFHLVTNDAKLLKAPFQAFARFRRLPLHADKVKLLDELVQI
jgi:hypothetical protein